MKRAVDRLLSDSWDHPAADPRLEWRIGNGAETPTLPSFRRS